MPIVDDVQSQNDEHLNNLDRKLNSHLYTIQIKTTTIKKQQHNVVDILTYDIYCVQ